MDTNQSQFQKEGHVVFKQGSTWTRFTDAMPTAPFFAYAKSTKQTHVWQTIYAMKQCEPLWESYTHWRTIVSSELPEPPREEMQKDRDVEAWRNWFHVGNNLRGQQTDAAWQAALAWERAEVAKIMKRYGYPAEFWDWTKAIDAIRARVGEVT
jgi:hypothetical protein